MVTWVRIILYHGRNDEESDPDDPNYTMVAALKSKEKTSFVYRPL